MKEVSRSIFLGTMDCDMTLLPRKIFCHGRLWNFDRMLYYPVFKLKQQCP